MEIELTSEQKKVKDSLVEWFNYSSNEPMVISGYAGTGKTSLAIAFRNELKLQRRNKNIHVSFMALTSKAASVMARKLGGIHRLDTCGTIHKFMYEPIFEISPKGIKIISGWRLRDIDHILSDLIIIDEGSMVSKKIWNDLLELRIPIVVFGDNEQLPPIGDEFDILQKPNFQLTEIHRQAKDNPIIKASMMVRLENKFPSTTDNHEIVVADWNDPNFQRFYQNISWNDNMINLCATNRIRTSINKMIRDRCEYDSDIQYPNERVVCLRNNYDTKFMNGEIFTIRWIMPTSDSKVMRMDLENSNGDILTTSVHSCCFNSMNPSEPMYEEMEKRKRKREPFEIDFFDYGYCISVHKSQGSEWDKVCLFNEQVSRWSDDLKRRWLYTGITRAKNKLILVTGL